MNEACGKFVEIMLKVEMDGSYSSAVFWKRRFLYSLVFLLLIEDFYSDRNVMTDWLG